MVTRSVIIENSFGSTLRNERESRGITLEAIAESTKIRRSLLLALESGDAAKLPRGIFQRGFVRAYAEAIGIQPEPLLAELARLSAAPGTAADETPIKRGAGALRLTLEPESAWRSTPDRRALAVLADTGAIVLMGWAIGLLAGTNTWAATGALGLVYYALGTMCLGRSFASWCLERAWSSAGTEQAGDQQRHRAIPSWLDVLVRHTARPAGVETSPIDSPVEPASAHSHAGRS
jgi:transcriptional regulator with XRE-family HTH domain